MEEGLLILQAGGNRLERVVCLAVVKQVVDVVEAVEGKDIRVAVLGVMKRPRENEQYER